MANRPDNPRGIEAEPGAVRHHAGIRSGSRDAREDPTVSGLEMMQEMVGATEPPFSMAATIPMRVVEVEEGKVVIESEPGAQFLHRP